MMEKSSSQQMSTRRKSCVACVKAKRRCDLQKPYCTRCSTRGLLCNYPRTNPGGIENLQSFDLAFEYPPYTNIPTITYQFDDLLNPALIPSKNIYLSKERLDSCVQYFKNYLTNIVQYGRTPFINPHLYNDALPPCLQDVYCICAAYLSKTATNETLIFRILSSKFDELVSKRQYCSFEDELASVQALNMYQIIRLFDGDIRQRGIAEAQFQVLDAWAIHLRQRGELELPPSIQSSPYREWLFIESVRRTVLMSIFLRAIYYAIKNGFCDNVADMAGLPLTVRGELWEAKSEGEWMQATRGGQPDVLTYHEFVDVWDGGSAGGDVENFQKMLLVGCIGEEGLRTRFLESLTRGVGWT
ncbi:hypothetical protein POJ06DRAFT_210532 [Lipomyces tetrasporus]|uniref:Zn(2)-C6 fungal-type domain-containing protein n=1 Tax=Lipomyces tetrasporus TaxID=54092 RepID=A0AAD7QT11_9ASCO|nr:uncharacterized protein POJ06DRAFT_210532 [Lipomyces tetrasporus]KAJ8100815.1 hypothetical protein POJ06DRAFT_210532 [Lipomyces tetrasporus]